MRKIKQTSEKTPPLPKDKPATYENKTKGIDTKVGNRQNDKQPTDKKAAASPQKTREKMEMDTTKGEHDPGITKR